MTADLSMRQASGECFNALLNLREIAGLTPPMLRACQNCYLAMHASRALDPVKFLNIGGETFAHRLQALQKAELALAATQTAEVSAGQKALDELSRALVDDPRVQDAVAAEFAGFVRPLATRDETSAFSFLPLILTTTRYLLVSTPTSLPVVIDHT